MATAATGGHAHHHPYAGNTMAGGAGAGNGGSSNGGRPGMPAFGGSMATLASSGSSLYSNSSGNNGVGSAIRTHASRPSLGERAFTTSALDSAAPLPSMTSLANRTANSAYGLYQNCLSLRRQLRRVPGFEDAFLKPNDQQQGQAGVGADGSSTSGEGLASSISPTALPSLPDDPVSEVCRCLRLGSSLCYLFNQLGIAEPLDINPDASPTNFKACQKGAAHFIMACSKHLGWTSEDQIFKVTELFSQDTNGTVKVIATVSKFLALLDERGVLLPEEESAAQVSDPSTLDTRGKIVKELLDTERKYVQDLEVLQEYRLKLAEGEILSQDTLHLLFLNLNAIVDFSRRILIGIEANASQPPELQRFGHLFVTMEHEFAVYEPYLVNFPEAQELALSLTKQENSPLSRVSFVMPVTEFPMFHVKPVQRFMRYYMLLEELCKYSDPKGTYYTELKEGTEASKRMTDRVNEGKRRKENKLAVEELRHRVEDWKGHELSSFGELLLVDQFPVIKSDAERDYLVYLFQKIVLCCKEVLPTGKSKVNKSNSMIRKSAGGAPQIPTGSAARRKTPLQLKGRIFINNVISATQVTKPGSFLLAVTWRGDSNEEAFSIKCNNAEQLLQWQKAITKTVEEVAANRRSRSVGPLSARRLASPHSQFPNTPQTELGPMPLSSHHPDAHLAYNSSSTSLASSGGHFQYMSHNPYGGTFDDEGDDGYTGDYEPSTGRSTPSMTSNASSRRGPTQSLPAGMRHQNERERDLQQMSSSNGGRPRAQTEDSNSAVIHQWRSQTPNGGAYPPAVPSLPRQSSGSSIEHSQPSQPSGLRHSSSRSALRSKKSQEWNSSGPSMPTPPPPHPHPYSSASSSGTVTPQPPSSTFAGRNLAQQFEDLPHGAAEPGSRMLRQNSQGSVPPMAAAPPMRSRSASSPNVYQLNPNQMSQLPQEQWNPYPQHDIHPHHLAGMQQHQPLPMSRSQTPQYAGAGGLPKRNAGPSSSTTTIASTTGSTTTNPPKRFSSSSIGTNRSSGDSSQSQGFAYQSPTSPVNGQSLPSRLPAPGSGANSGRPMNGSAQAPSSPSSAVKIRVYYGEDNFVIVALASITFPDLVEKVVRKIHMCGARAVHDSQKLKLKYEDEDGDKIEMSGDEDVAMAFDGLRQGGAGHSGTLILYAEWA